MTDIGEGRVSYKVIRMSGRLERELGRRLGWQQNNVVGEGEGILQYCTPRDSYSAPPLWALNELNFIL